MHVVMNDLLYCENVSFRVPANPVARGATHGTLEENLKATFNLVGLELVQYGNVQRHLIRSKMIGHDANGAEVEETKEDMEIRVQA